KQAMNITIWGNVLNILLSIILAKGMFGITPLGIVGVGYATAIDRILTMLAMSVYVLRSQTFKVYINKLWLFHVDYSRVENIFKIGAPVALQYEIGRASCRE